MIRASPWGSFTPPFTTTRSTKSFTTYLLSIKELEDIGDTMDAGGKSAIKRKFRFPTFTSNQFKTKKEYMLPRTVFKYNEQKIVDTSSSEFQSKSKKSEEDSDGMFMAIDETQKRDFSSSLSRLFHH